MLHLLAACKKYIKNGHKCCEKHAKALMDLRKKCVEQADDCLSVTSSTIASSTASSKKLSKLSGTKKVTPPKKKEIINQAWHTRRQQGLKVFDNPKSNQSQSTSNSKYCYMFCVIFWLATRYYLQIFITAFHPILYLKVYFPKQKNQSGWMTIKKLNNPEHSSYHI